VREVIKYRPKDEFHSALLCSDCNQQLAVFSQHLSAHVHRIAHRTTANMHQVY